MHKVVVCLTAILCMTAGLVATGTSEAKSETGELVLYTSHATDWTEPIISEFEKHTGITVTLVSGGTGDLIERIHSEKEAPVADILWGGGSDSYQAIINLLQPYAHKHMSKVLDVTRDPGNRWHGTTIDPMVIIYNPTLVEEASAPKGWADLLNPAFKGNIAHADPERSGSAFMALVIQLLSMGGDNETGWTYMKRFVEALDGKVLSSSSAVYEGVADGRYAVGITYEEAALKSASAGADLKVVYPVEGSSKVPSPIAIIKGARNLGNARKFVDYILSKEVQTVMGDINRRTVRTDIQLPANMVPNNKLGDIPYDPLWVGGNKQRLLDRWIQLIDAQ